MIYKRNEFNDGYISVLYLEDKHDRLFFHRVVQFIFEWLGQVYKLYGRNAARAVILTTSILYDR